jgi:hypothetical protein
MILCAGCNREIEVGDRYILDTVAGFLKHDADPLVDGLVAEIFGADDGKVRFCEDCTEPGGDYLFETYYGDEEEDAAFV